MKRRLNSLVYFISILAITSFACAAMASGGGDAPPSDANTSAPPATKTSAPSATDTSVPTPTKKPTNTPPPTITPTEKPKDFFTEEFEDKKDLEQWFNFPYGPGYQNTSNLKIFQENDGLTIDLGALDLYLYYMYQPYLYSDVKLTMVVENQGRNNNNVSLVCRMNSDSTEWYEFSVESGGMWYLYAYKEGYKVLSNGGVNALKQGKETNQYGMTCEGNQITLSVNDKVLKTHTDTTYAFKEGYVGFNISSLNVLPITVNVKSFDIAAP